MRSVDEWRGASDDTVPPPRVRIRVFEQSRGCCYICGRRIGVGEYWQADHVIALCNGGANREANLKAACRNCCYKKTAEDSAEKSEIARIAKKHILPKPKSTWGTCKGSKFKRKMNGQTVLREKP